MANFEKDGQSIHGLTKSIELGKAFAFGLWGPRYKSNPNSDNWDMEFDVSILESNSGLTLTKVDVVNNVRKYSVVGSSSGTYTLVAKDRFGSICTKFTLNIKSGKGKRFTTEQLNTSGTMGWVGWPNASVPVQALAKQLELVSGGALSKFGTSPPLQGSGHIDRIDEHYAGLSLDIKLNSKTTTQRQHAHNLIRFFVTNRIRLGWLHIYYENWGFGQNGPIDPVEGHYDHIHIDWMDHALAEPAGADNRKSWTAISWPDVASNHTYLLSSEALEELRLAWNSSEAPFDTIIELYAS
jgi:hypothetical protein